MKMQTHIGTCGSSVAAAVPFGSPSFSMPALDLTRRRVGLRFRLGLELGYQMTVLGRI
jgi:hypothetical protein